MNFTTRRSGGATCGNATPQLLGRLRAAFFVAIVDKKHNY
jgi:hypothetical protein